MRKASEHSSPQASTTGCCVYGDIEGKALRNVGCNDAANA